MGLLKTEPEPHTCLYGLRERQSILPHFALETLTTLPFTNKLCLRGVVYRSYIHVCVCVNVHLCVYVKIHPGGDHIFFP